MRNSHKNIYKSYQERNKSLFNKSDPFNQPKTPEEKGDKTFQITVTGYKKDNWTDIIQASSKEEARKKAKK